MKGIKFQRENKLLKAIILILGVGMAMTSPYFGLYLSRGIAKEIFKRLDSDKSFGEDDIRKSLYQLKRHRFIEYKILPNNEVRVELTKKGKKRFEIYNFEDLKIKSSKKWDRKWRIVIFDIPEKKKVARETLREKLKKLGFFRIQKSVWVYPYECKDEINFVCEFFNVENYVLYFSAPLESDRSLRRHFKLI